jgi:uncharacterized membrane protein
MPKGKSSIVVNVPVEKVWALFDDVEKLPDWMSLMTEVSNVQGQGEGSTYNWTYKFMGVPFKGTTKVLEEVPNKKRVVKSEGGISSTWTWEFASVEGGTKISVMVEYGVPGQVLGKFVEPFVVKQGNRDVAHALDNFKHQLEEL